MPTTPLPRFGTFGALVEYGIDRRLSAHSTIGATMVVGIPFGVKLRVRFSRFTQTYIFPLQLTDGEVNCFVVSEKRTSLRHKLLLYYTV